MGVSSGQLGFDEGRVLQALSRPFLKRKVVTYEYDRKGRVEQEYTDEYNISIAHVIAAGLLVFGPAFLLKFNADVMSDPATNEYVKNIFAPASGEDEASKIFRRILDPFKVIWK